APASFNPADRPRPGTATPEARHVVRTDRGRARRQAVSPARGPERPAPSRRSGSSGAGARSGTAPVRRRPARSSSLLCHEASQILAVVDELSADDDAVLDLE